MAGALESVEKAFAQFFGEKLRPEVERIGHKRKQLMKWALLAAVGVFAVMFFLAYYFLSPYFKTLGEHNLSYWPLLLLIPAALATVSFSITYIILLRHLVNEFRKILIKRTAEFIDPTMVYRNDEQITETELRHSLLFGDLSRIKLARDNFIGRRGGFSFEFCFFCERLEKRSVKSNIDGIYYTARFDSEFPALLVVLSESEQADTSKMIDIIAEMGIPNARDLVRVTVQNYDLQLLTLTSDQDNARRVLAAIFTPELLVFCHKHKLRPHLSCVGGKFSVALFGKTESSGNINMFEGFDFDLCREFSLRAVMCMKLAEGIDRLDKDFWAKKEEERRPATASQRAAAKQSGSYDPVNNKQPENRN